MLYEKDLVVPEEVTNKKLEEFGFTNFNPPSYYFMRMLNSNVSINITIDKKTRDISLSVLDERILQGVDFTQSKALRKKVNQHIQALIDSGILVEATVVA